MMKKIKQRLQNLSLGEDKILPRKELRKIIGGMIPCTGWGGTCIGGGGMPCCEGLTCDPAMLICVPTETGACLRCNTTQECEAVNKGTCDYCPSHGLNCCSGWHEHN